MSNEAAYYFAVEAARQLTPEDMRRLAAYITLLVREGEAADGFTAADLEGVPAPTPEVLKALEQTASGFQSPR